LKTIICKITFGKVFAGNTNEPDDKIAPSKATGQQFPTHQPLFTILDPQKSRPHADFTSRSQNNVGDLPTGVHLQFLLISEIRDILGHLKQKKPHHYTFEEWAWYLKLIGEDENDPRTHGSVDQQQCDHTALRKWSWIGNQSPLISTNGESEWILGRLMDRLQLSLTGENKGQE
jgi:potassium channel subfamily K